MLCRNVEIFNGFKFKFQTLRKSYAPINNSNEIFFNTSEAVVRRCSVKKVFLEISQKSQENTCARDSFLIKLLGTTASDTSK